MKQLLKKSFTLLEMLISIIVILMLTIVLVELIDTVMHKRYQIGYNMKRVNINTVFNSNFSTMVCYTNLNEQIGIDSNGSMKYGKFQVNNSTNTDEENMLCSKIRNKIKLYGNNFLNGLEEKNSIESFILTRTNFQNISTYKILYVIRVLQEENINKTDYYIIRIGNTSIEGFLTKNDTNKVVSDLIKQSDQGKLHGNDISNFNYGYKYKFVRLNMIDDKQVDLVPGSSGGGSTEIKDYTFNYNYFLFQLQLHTDRFSNLDYFLFRN